MVPTLGPPEFDACWRCCCCCFGCSRLVSRRGSSRLAALVGAGFAATHVVPCASGPAGQTVGQVSAACLLNSDTRSSVTVHVGRRLLLDGQVANEARTRRVVHLAGRAARVAVDARELGLRRPDQRRRVGRPGVELGHDLRLQPLAGSVRREALQRVHVGGLAALGGDRIEQRAFGLANRFLRRRNFRLPALGFRLTRDPLALEPKSVGFRGGLVRGGFVGPALCFLGAAFGFFGFGFLRNLRCRRATLFIFAASCGVRLGALRSASSRSLAAEASRSRAVCSSTSTLPCAVTASVEFG